MFHELTSTSCIEQERYTSDDERVGQSVPTFRLMFFVPPNFCLLSSQRSHPQFHSLLSTIHTSIDMIEVDSNQLLGAFPSSTPVEQHPKLTCPNSHVSEDPSDLDSSSTTIHGLSIFISYFFPNYSYPPSLYGRI